MFRVQVLGFRVFTYFEAQGVYILYGSFPRLGVRFFADPHIMDHGI